MISTAYVRDAGGNVMAVYEKVEDAPIENFAQKEVHIYGSSRLGMMTQQSVAAEGITLPGGYEDASLYTYTRGEKVFELSNHLGNVLVTVTDKHVQFNNGSGVVGYYEADIATANDYYPFKYRYGFNGKENDNEVEGEGNQQDYGMRIYDPRLARFLSVDPLTPKYPELTPYQFASNRPIDGIDRDGLEYVKCIPKFEYNGTWVDYVSAIDNGVIDILNLVPTLWNSGVATVQSISRGTYGEDLRRDTKQAYSGLKQTAVKVWNEPLKTLTSPEALEFLVSSYFGAKLIPVGGGKGNLLKVETNVAKTVATDVNITTTKNLFGGNSIKLVKGRTTTAIGRYPGGIEHIKATGQLEWV